MEILSSILLTLFGIIVGTIATWVVSRKYYIKSTSDLNMIIDDLEKKLIDGMDNTQKLVEQTAQEIVKSIISQDSIKVEGNKEKLKSVVEKRMDEIREQLNTLLKNATEFTEIMDHFYSPHTNSSEVERRIFLYVPEHEFKILRLLNETNRPMAQWEISHKLTEDIRLIRYAMRSLLDKGLVFNRDEGGAVAWFPTQKGFGVLTAKKQIGNQNISAQRPS